MAQTYNKLNIEINQKVTDIITAVQDDTNSRYLDVQLFDNGTPINLTGQEVRIFLKKPDGTNIWNDGEITSATEGRCQFLLTTQTLAVCGVLETQISIWQNNEEILSTEVFKIFVTKSLRSSGSIESSNEYGSLVILFQNIYESLDLMTEMVQSFGTAGAVAQGIPVTTFWQMLEAVYTVNAEALANASVTEVLERMGLTNDSGATATTGTLMAKVNDLIGYNNEQTSSNNILLIPSNNLKETIYNSATSISQEGIVYLGMFTAPSTGIIKAVLSRSDLTNYLPNNIMVGKVGGIYTLGNNDAICVGGSETFDFPESGDFIPSTTSVAYRNTFGLDQITVGVDTDQQVEFNISVERNNTYVFFTSISVGAAKPTRDFSSLTIYYDEIEVG